MAADGPDGNNAVNSIFTGRDYLSGSPMIGYDTAIGILSIIPIGRVTGVASLIERAVAREAAVSGESAVAKSETSV